jgi:hypothetical protein
MRHLLTATVCLAAFAATPARATLTLNGTGIADGFTLSTYFTDPNGSGSYYDLSNAPLADGTLLGVDYAEGQLLKLNDTNGQSLGTVLGSVSFSGAINAATVNGVTYAASSNLGLYAVSNSLTLTPVAVQGGVRPGLGLWANPVTGHLICNCNTGIVDIDPVTGKVTFIASNGGADGVTVSPDGQTVYVEANGQILGYNISNLSNIQTVYNSGNIGHSPDGTAVIAGGTFAGDVIVNNNDGTVGLLTPGGPSGETIIASGGTRGDFVTPDTSNGTLFLSEEDATFRLGLQGGSLGSNGPTNDVPEPGSLLLIGTGIAALAGLRRRARARAAG